MKKLIFLCGYGEFYFKLANMTAHTIRLSGYTDDIIIFTIHDATSPFATCINLATHPESQLIITPKNSKFFHAHLCEQFGYEPYNSKYDFFIIKTLPGNIIDKSKYDFILYMDSDMLVHSPLDKIFTYDTVVSDYCGRSAWIDMKRLRKYLTPEEISIAKSIPGFSGGACGVPSKHYKFYDDYRKYYLQYINEIPHDQPALSFTSVKHHKQYNVQPLPRKAYWIHYWGNRKSSMIRDYMEKYAHRKI
ncbi:MAG: hypothetical protein QXU32_00520 [Nitrososphaerales archaeon]